jgi:hypothetical protein
MAHHFGANYENHPMVAPLWQKLEGIEQHLDRLDQAVNAILKHLNITLPDTDTKIGDSASPTAEEPATAKVSDELYKYKALDLGRSEIRLLALSNSSNDEDELKGALVHISLETPQIKTLKRYTALSYTWGEPKMDRCIVIDGHPLFVTKNLESALRQMRKTASKSPVNARPPLSQSLWWIDQICMLLALCPFENYLLTYRQASTKPTSKSEATKSP